MPKIEFSAGAPVVMSIGGSMIVSEAIPNVGFLKSLRELVAFSDKQLLIIAGGGKTCRNYQAAASDVREMTSEELDWIGIHSTRLNAQLVRHVLGDLANDHVVTDPDGIPENWKEKVLMGAGFQPGNSSDLPACQLAKKIGAKVLVNVSNVDHVYTDDPSKNPEAKPVTEMDWDQYLQIIPSEWTPGLSTPFDPVASKYCRDEGLQVAIVSGESMDNLKSLISGEEFSGTVLHP